MRLFVKSKLLWINNWLSLKCMITCIKCSIILYKWVLINWNFWTKSIDLYIIMRLLVILLLLDLMSHHQIRVVIFSIFWTNFIKIWHFLLLISRFTHWIPLIFSYSTIYTFLGLNFFNSTTSSIFIYISLWSWWIWISSLAIGYIFKKTWSKVNILILSTHLTYSHIFCFIFNNHFFKNIILFSSSFFWWFIICLICLCVHYSLRIQIIQIDFIVIFIFKCLKTTIRAFF